MAALRREMTAGSSADNRGISSTSSFRQVWQVEYRRRDRLSVWGAKTRTEVTNGLIYRRNGVLAPYTLQRRSGRVAGKDPIELGSGTDAELEEHLAQVVLDRARADE